MYLIALIPVVLLFACTDPAVVQGIDVKIIQQHPLEVPAPDVLATVLLLTIEPADVGLPVHYHSGPVIGYVIEGQFLHQVNDDPPRILSAGNSYLQKDHSNHVWSANATNDTLCKVVAIVYGRFDEDVTTFVQGFKRESWSDALLKAKAKLT